MTTYAQFFKSITGHSPYPYQKSLGTEAWPEVLDIPTGLGKTAAVVIAWLWKRLSSDTDTGRRLVYCLPMRTLVEQTRDAAEAWCHAAAALFEDAGLRVPSVHVLMGGQASSGANDGWERSPEAPAILVGTQDMLLSRALNRGYGLVQYRWPMHFGLLHSDVLWVLDETQLMGVGVETSAQLEGLRASFGTFGPAHTVWMSATLGREQLDTVDHRAGEGFATAQLTAPDHQHDEVARIHNARKPISRHPVVLETDDSKHAKYCVSLAVDIQRRHGERGGLTLVILNRVERAQAVYSLLAKTTECPVALVHSRFRPGDRKRHQDLLHAEGDRIVVATQAVEAGVDVSALTLFTELAPWPSMVQRFGRCNRTGLMDDAEIHWFDIVASGKKEALALPYTPADLEGARTNLAELNDAGPQTLRDVEYTPPPIVRAVLRRRDLVDLFDTTPDLGGNELDVARYIRDGNDTDVRVYWREIDTRPDQLELGDPVLSQPARAELCNVSITQFKKFMERVRKLRDKTPGTPPLVWRWEHLARRFETVRTVRPGQTVMLAHTAGGYDPDLGWTGDKGVVPVVADLPTNDHEGNDDDFRTRSVWVELPKHLQHVEYEAAEFAKATGLSSLADHLAEAGRWHDVGKAHDAFQTMLLAAQPPVADKLWAKSAASKRTSCGRAGFRHELASALAYLATPNDRSASTRNLIAYLIAAHHGKVRLSLRAMPNEQPPQSGAAFARGVHDGDRLPAFEFADGVALPSTELSLDIARMGEGSWLSRMLALRDDPELGPFRLALLEALICAADWRASAKEESNAYGDA